MVDSPRKIEPAPDPTNRFGSTSKSPTLFYGGAACNSEESPKICFWTNYVTSKFGVETNFLHKPIFQVLLETEESSNCGVDSIADNARLRSRCARSHLISSSEARGRGIFRFHGGHVFCGLTIAHMQSLSLRVFSRGDHRLTVCRELEVCFGQNNMRSRSGM